MAKQRKKQTNKKKPTTPRKQPNNKSKIINNKCLVWRIFHFKERFELPEDMRMCRKSGLQYTRDFVSAAGGDEAVGYLKQFGLLANGDGKELGMLKGLYRELINMAAEQSWAKRGYLIDADDKPLSDAQIGRLLNIKAPDMRKILRKFVTVKLLDKVDMPDFDMSLNELPPRKKSDDKIDGDGKKGDSRNGPENSGKNRAPLKNDKTAKPPNGGKGKEKQRATHGLTAVNGEGNVNCNSAKHQADAQDKDRAQGQVEGEPPSAPTTTPSLPSEPHESDDLGDSQVIPSPAPQSSLKPASGRQRRPSIPSAVDYDKYDEQVGTKIYKALGYRWPIDTGNARREICSFASVWHQARESLARLPPELIDELGRRAIVEARKIGKRKTNRNKAAVFNDTLKKIVKARLHEAM